MTTEIGRPRDRGIDDAVLRVTVELLAESSYADLSVDAIAARAGTSKPAIYRRWRTKAHLVHEAAFPDLGPDPADDDVAGEIARLCRGALAMYADPVVREAVPGLLHDLSAEPAMRRLIHDRLEAAARRQLAAQLAEGVGDGAVRPSVDPDTVMDAIAGAAWYAVCVRNVTDLDTAATALADLISCGVLSR